MKVNNSQVDKLILPLVILILLFSSCNANRSNNSDKKHITTSNSFESSIDSSKWLKPSSGVRGIFEDSKGNLWFTSTEFVCMYDGSEMRYFNEEDGLNGIGSVYEDKNGIIWVGCGFYAYSFDPSNGYIKGKVHFTTHPLVPDTTGNKWGASEDDLWFQKGMERFGNTPGPPGVYRNHNGEISFLAFPFPDTNDENRYYPTSSAIKGNDGTIWFGTMEIVAGYKDGSFTLIDEEKIGHNHSVSIGIRGIYVDSKNNLWMADNGNGFYVYDGDTVINFTKLHHLDKGDRKGNTLHRAFCVSEDDEGNMWFGTVYSGIWKYDGKTFTNYSEKEGIKSENFWTIYKTKNGELLFAGETPGAVYKFNGNSFDRVY